MGVRCETDRETRQFLIMGVRGKQYRNQTQLHEWLAKITFNYLSGVCTQRGLVWRQEHTIHNGMRPDAVAFCSLQMQHEERIIGKMGYNDLMFIFESKVTYSDFKNTFNGSGEYKNQPYANVHFLVIPKGFSSIYDLSMMPDYWGILEPNVSALHMIKPPKYIDIGRLFFLEAAYSILHKWGWNYTLLERNIEL
jgi:hypothetical protein